MASAGKVDCSSLLRGRKGRPPELRLCVISGKAGKHVLFTDWKLPSSRLVYDFSSTEFHFPTPHDLHKKDDVFQVALQEKGIQAAKAQQQSTCSCICGWAVNIFCCPFKYVLCLPCTLVCCCLSSAKDAALAGAVSPWIRHFPKEIDFVLTFPLLFLFSGRHCRSFGERDQPRCGQKCSPFWPAERQS